jgi:replication factor C subunit 2/4
VLELNASDARGIDVVRSKIKMFAQKKVTLPPGKHKIIILDEADSMTNAAQQALRRTMEIYSSTTRFAIACNNSTKIIEPIQSRCAILRFSRLQDVEILTRLQQICAAENVNYDIDGLEAIIFVAEVLFYLKYHANKILLHIIITTGRHEKCAEFFAVYS